MRALFGHGEHPDGDAIIAAYLTAHVRAGMTDRQLETARDEAIARRRLGRPFPAYEPLEKFDNRVEARLAVIREETGREPTEAEVKKVKAEEARRQRAAVAGFDLVFSPVKSAALLWALDERPRVRDAIRSRPRGALRRGPGPGRGARRVHPHRRRRHRPDRDERADRGGVRALGLPRRRPEPAHPRRRLVQGPGHRREVAGPGRPRRCTG